MCRVLTNCLQFAGTQTARTALSSGRDSEFHSGLTALKKRQHAGLSAYESAGCIHNRRYVFSM